MAGVGVGVGERGEREIDSPTVPTVSCLSVKTVRWI